MVKGRVLSMDRNGTFRRQWPYYIRTLAGEIVFIRQMHWWQGKCSRNASANTCYVFVLVLGLWSILSQAGPLSTGSSDVWSCKNKASYWEGLPPNANGYVRLYAPIISCALARVCKATINSKVCNSQRFQFIGRTRFFPKFTSLLRHGGFAEDFGSQVKLSSPILY